MYLLTISEFGLEAADIIYLNVAKEIILFYAQLF